MDKHGNLYRQVYIPFVVRLRLTNLQILDS